MEKTEIGRTQYAQLVLLKEAGAFLPRSFQTKPSHHLCISLFYTCLLYTSYLGAQNKADRKAVIKATEEFEGIHIFMDYENSVKWSFRCNEFPTTLVLENGKVVSKEVGYFGQLTGTNENE